MLASAAGGAGRDDMLADGGYGTGVVGSAEPPLAPLQRGDVSKLKICLSCSVAGLRGCGEGERPNPVLERVGTSTDPLGVVKMRFGSPR